MLRGLVEASRGSVEISARELQRAAIVMGSSKRRPDVEDRAVAGDGVVDSPGVGLGRGAGKELVPSEGAPVRAHDRPFAADASTA